MTSQFAQLQERLAVLTDINQLLMSTVEPDDLLQEILRAVIRLFAVEGCSFGLVDDATHQLVFFAMAGKAQVEEFRIDLGQGIAGWVARTGESAISNDVARDP